jgi:hypothetical protein
MTPDEALRRSSNARRLMADPLLTETLDLMERDVMEAWIVCPVRDTEGREALWRMAVTTRKFRDLLHGTMESGKLAADQIRRRDETIAQRAKNLMRRA